MPVPLPQCLFCVHLLRDKSVQGLWFCAAFPRGEGIPVEISSNKIIHDHVVKGQVDEIFFEPTVEDGNEYYIGPTQKKRAS